MPTDRRVVFGTTVIPTQSLESEESSIRRTEFQSSPNGVLGGKGIASIAATQWGDGWTSFSNEGAGWEDQGDVWELKGEPWSGALEIGTSGVNLTDNVNQLAFLYIKNTGSPNNCLVSINGSSGAYYITIPPNGSIHLRGDSSFGEEPDDQFKCADVYVKSHSPTTIEFIIAKAA